MWRIFFCKQNKEQNKKHKKKMDMPVWLLVLIVIFIVLLIAAVIILFLMGSPDNLAGNVFATGVTTINPVPNDGSVILGPGFVQGALVSKKKQHLLTLQGTEGLAF